MMSNPTWPRYKYLEVAYLVAGAGGDPWAINESLDAGRPGEISQLANAFRAAGVCTGETEDDWIAAKRTFGQAWVPQVRPDHPINDSVDAQRISKALHHQREKLETIASELQTVAGSLAAAQHRSRETITAVESQLREIDEAIDRALRQLSAGQELDVWPVMAAATDHTAAALARVRHIREDYTGDLERALDEMQDENANRTLDPTRDADPSLIPRDAGSEQRPNATDINDPDVKWQAGIEPEWQQSWRNPMLVDNPPGYTGGPGPARDAAWQTYLANFPKDQKQRGFLPNPDAVNDPGLKVLGHAATQLGVSYAWGGGGPEGPSKGTLDRGGTGAKIYQDDQRIGFDCSGLTHYAAAQARPGVDIGTWTGAQLDSTELTNVAAGTPLKPGDFIYYGHGPAKHVGIYVAPGVIINAPESGLPVQLDHRATAVGPDPTDGVIRALRMP